MPILFLVLFGVIEFGMALNDYQSIRHGVRDGARQAVVQQYGSEAGDCTISGLDPATTPTEVKKVICITKDRIGLGDDVRIRLLYTKSTGSGGDFGSVAVCAQRNVDPFTGAIPAIDGIALMSSIQMRMEDDIPASIVFVSPDTTKTYAETPPAGQDWAGC